MKRIVFLCVLGLFIGMSCNSDKKASTETPAQPDNSTTITAPPAGAPEANVPANFTPTTAPPVQQSAEAPQNAKGVWHFTCPKGCPGGGGGATPCAKCGTTLAHNAAYHQQ